MTTPDNFQNVHGQKIGVRYYANKLLKPRSFFWNGERLIGHPLYVQVTAHNETVRLKSVIDIAVDADKVDQYLKNDSMRLLIKDEKEEIVRRVLADRPNSRSSFKLTTALKNYSYETVDLSYVIGHYLMSEYVKARSKDLVECFRGEYERLPTYAWIKVNQQESTSDGVEPSEAFLEEAAAAVLWGDDRIISPMAVYKRVRAEAVQPGSNVRKLLESYGLPFFRLGDFSEVLRYQSSRLLTVGFFMSTEFESVFTEYCDSLENLQSIRHGFGKFCANNGEFARNYLGKKAPDPSQLPFF